MLGIFRTDYMRSVSDKNEKETAEEWKNVEINTISCSFAGLSPLVNQFHRYLQQYKALFSNTPIKGQIEGSISGEVIPQSLAEAVTAWKASVPLADFTASYLKTHPEVASLTPIVLVVIQEGERNTGDQYKLLFSLFERSGVLPLRRTHQQIHEHLTLLDHEAGKAPFMVLEKKYVVALVYYRSAYVPSDYEVPGVTTFEENPLWQARLHMEQSNAVKCPSIPYHLMTFKKLQQKMTDVDHFLTPYAFNGAADKAKTMAQHFVGQYSLNKDEYTTDNKQQQDPEYYIQQAVAHPERYVLKPQLEGGGNLIAGETMQSVLTTRKADDATLYHKIRKEYILMEKIHYPKVDGTLFRQEKFYPFEQNVCSELGIYGVVLSDGNTDNKNAYVNRHGGYVVRTKPADVEDGGVMAGVACLDSALLLED
ncbi:Eukaryotic glutathione synthase, ATP binding domain/Eukaryotic glutathione synthase, putative [Angomonas deanei]|uniref:Glutathione synthetase n=1 Tax=Angomonas deanei TaxID=59799 RepID=A0A7G2CIX3_9TRYP|nr:Eukaryotic glutathione synthase, ATP binding domain/Eukaryotic glutathione synthase, putative [Angomonas deanei]